MEIKVKCGYVYDTEQRVIKRVIRDGDKILRLEDIAEMEVINHEAIDSHYVLDKRDAYKEVRVKLKPDNNIPLGTIKLSLQMQGYEDSGMLEQQRG